MYLIDTYVALTVASAIAANDCFDISWEGPSVHNPNVRKTWYRLGNQLVEFYLPRHGAYFLGVV